jgi:hypothetical protein
VAHTTRTEVPHRALLVLLALLATTVPSVLIACSSVRVASIAHRTLSLRFPVPQDLIAAYKWELLLVTAQLAQLDTTAKSQVYYLLSAHKELSEPLLEQNQQWRQRLQVLPMLTRAPHAVKAASVHSLE